MKQSRFGIVGNNLLFKENFEGKQWTRKIGGTPTNVTYNNGVAEFNDLAGIDNDRIGCLNYNNLGDGFFLPGKLSQPKIMNGVLSSNEITQIYTNERRNYE